MRARVINQPRIQWMWRHITQLQPARPMRANAALSCHSSLRFHPRSFSTAAGSASDSAPLSQVVQSNNAETTATAQTNAQTLTAQPQQGQQSTEPATAQQPAAATSSPPMTPVNLTMPPTQAPKPGFLISDAPVFLADGTQETINDLLKGKRVLLLGLVGAYTRLCQQSLAQYAHKCTEFKKKYGIEHIYAVSVNDHSVLSAFVASLSLQSYTGLTLIADFDARMTRWLGMEIDLSSVGFGTRSKRFAMLVDKQQVKVVRVESNVGLLDVTSCESMTAVLKELKREDEERVRKEKENELKAQQAAAAAAEAAEKEKTAASQPAAAPAAAVAETPQPMASEGVVPSLPSAAVDEAVVSTDQSKSSAASSTSATQ